MDRETVILNRDELYEAVWRQPVERLAGGYGISGPALAKICRKLNVPVPPRGHWARAAAGTARRRPPLPQLRPGQPSQHVIHAFRTHMGPPLGSDVEEAIARERTWESRVIVPEVLETPHAFVRKSKGCLFRAGLKSKAVRLERSCLDVTVSRAQLGRALRIMDALLKALEARGHKVFMTEPRTFPGYRGDTRQPSETGVHVGNIAVEFGIEEVIDSIRRGEPRPKGDDVKAWFEWRDRNPPPWYIYRPSGRLSLVIRSWSYGQRKSWRDGKRQKLEDLLNEFIASVLRTAERRRVDGEERERREREEAELRLKRELEQARRELEAARRRDLEERVRKFEFAASVRRLVEAMRSREAEALTGETIAWIAWAEALAAETEVGALARVAMSSRT